MNAIKEARINKALSQQELAAAVSRTQGYISDLETGKAYPSRELAKDLADFLEINVVRVLYPND